MVLKTRKRRPGDRTSTTRIRSADKGGFVKIGSPEGRKVAQASRSTISLPPPASGTFKQPTRESVQKFSKEQLEKKIEEPPKIEQKRIEEPPKAESRGFGGSFAPPGFVEQFKEFRDREISPQELASGIIPGATAVKGAAVAGKAAISSKALSTTIAGRLQEFNAFIKGGGNPNALITPKVESLKIKNIIDSIINPKQVIGAVPSVKAPNLVNIRKEIIQKGVQVTRDIKSSGKLQRNIEKNLPKNSWEVTRDDATSQVIMNSKTKRLTIGKITQMAVDSGLDNWVKVGAIVGGLVTTYGFSVSISWNWQQDAMQLIAFNSDFRKGLRDGDEEFINRALELEREISDPTFWENIKNSYGFIFNMYNSFEVYQESFNLVREYHEFIASAFFNSKRLFSCFFVAVSNLSIRLTAFSASSLPSSLSTVSIFSSSPFSRNSGNFSCVSSTIFYTSCRSIFLLIMLRLIIEHHSPYLSHSLRLLCLHSLV